MRAPAFAMFPLIGRSGLRSMLSGVIVMISWLVPAGQKPTAVFALADSM